MKLGRQRSARWALIAITMAMALALLWTAWANKRRIDESSFLLIRGQVGTFLGNLRQLSRDHEPRRSPAAFEKVLEDEYAEGLRYIALVDDSGKILVEAGRAELAETDRDAGERRDILITRGQTRARAVFPSRRPAADEDHASRPTLVLELEPIVANRLEQDANRTLLLNAVVAGAFLLVAVVLSKLLQQREREEERVERERRLAQLGEMSAVLAHEMRNPLASLKGHAQLLAEQLEAGTKQRKKADRIVAEAKRIEDLGTTLLDFLRSGQVELSEAKPADLVRQAAEAVDTERVHVDTAAAPEVWRLDPLRIRQVLTNLMLNAVQASEANQAVEVAVGRDGDALAISVHDHGPGIEPGEEDRIFEAFYTKRTKGVGLGLSVARRIVEMHGGTIKASNHPDGGALFRILIPG